MSGKHGEARPGRRRFPATPGRRPRVAVPARRPATDGRWSGPPAATGSRAIFRREALEFHARGRDTTGGVVRLGAPWLRWSYRLTLVLVAAGVAAVMLAPARQSSSGSAVIDPGSGRFAALFPVALAPDLGSARGLSFALPGAGPNPARIGALHVTLAGPAAARKAGLAAPRQPSILLTGRLLAGVPPGGGSPVRTQAVVDLPARSVVAALGHELTVMLGRGGAGP